ncbi:MAG: tetratricopeptide repeat protein [Rhodocyclaceae bacterium]
MSTGLEQARGHFLDGVAHFEQGRLVEARACFEASLALAPGRASVLGNLGITLYRLGETRQAGAVLAEAVAADPRHAEAWVTLGLAAHADGDWQQAVAALERGLALQPGPAPTWLTLGRCRQRLGALEAALEAFEQAVAVDPGRAEAWTERGTVLRALGRNEAAAESFRQALDRGGDAALNHFFLASVSGAPGPASPPRRYVESLFDDYAPEFESHLVGELGYCGHTQLLAPLLATGRRLTAALDLGCGTGLCGERLRGRAEAVDGVDVSAAMVAQARARGVYRDLWHADLLEHLNANTRSYGLVMAADVFIYVGELDGIFGEVRRCLEAEGCFLFTVELLAGTDAAHPQNDAAPVLQPSLRYAHSEAYLRALAQRHGFVVDVLMQAPIRYEQGCPVQGAYVHLRRAPS